MVTYITKKLLANAFYIQSPRLQRNPEVRVQSALPRIPRAPPVTVESGKAHAISAL